MKKIFVILFVLSFQYIFSQEKDFQKNNFLFDIGFWHSKNWKNKTVPALDDDKYLYQETFLPGYTKKPSFYLHAGITYQRMFSKRFNFKVNLNYSNNIDYRVYNADTLAKYYIFPDSLRDILPESFYHHPILKNTQYHYINLIPSIGYNYKRVGISLGYFFSILTIENYHYEYHNYPNHDKILLKWFRNSGFMYKLDYLIIKRKYPLKIFFEVKYGAFAGIEIQMNKNKNLSH